MDNDQWRRHSKYHTMRGRESQDREHISGWPNRGSTKGRDIKERYDKEERSIVEEYRYMKHNREVEKEEGY